MLVCVICLPYPRLPVRRAPKSEFWSQTHLGSNLPLSGCATLGESLHLSEPRFPFQREPGTLVHSVGVKNYILSKKLENKNYVKTFFLVGCSRSARFPLAPNSPSKLGRRMDQVQPQKLHGVRCSLCWQSPPCAEPAV